MYGICTEIAVLLRNFLDFIWNLSDVFTVHICSARAQIQSLKSLFIFEGWFWESVLKNHPITNNDDENVVKILK